MIQPYRTQVSPPCFCCPPFTPSIGPFFLVSFRYTPRQIALLPGDAQHLVVVEADHNEYNQAEGQVRGGLAAVLLITNHTLPACFAGFVLVFRGAVCLPNLIKIRCGDRVLRFCRRAG